MKINHSVLDQVSQHQAKLVVVTKYLDANQTERVRQQLIGSPVVLGWGENRIQSLEAKRLPRPETHFIGRLQSRQFSAIVEHCGTIHSLDSVPHAEKLNHIIEQKKCSKIKVFIQVNVGGDPDKAGVQPSDLPSLLVPVKALPNLEIIGLSTMGWGEFNESEKRTEFRQLVQLRDQYLPNGLTSAGTSRDYVLALEEGIDVVRVGSALF